MTFTPLEPKIWAVLSRNMMIPKIRHKNSILRGGPDQSKARSEQGRNVAVRPQILKLKIWKVAKSLFHNILIITHLESNIWEH